MMRYWIKQADEDVKSWDSRLAEQGVVDASELLARAAALLGGWFSEDKKAFQQLKLKAAYTTYVRLGSDAKMKGFRLLDVFMRALCCPEGRTKWEGGFDKRKRMSGEELAEALAANISEEGCLRHGMSQEQLLRQVFEDYSGPESTYLHDPGSPDSDATDGSVSGRMNVSDAHPLERGFTRWMIALAEETWLVSFVYAAAKALHEKEGHSVSAVQAALVLGTIVKDPDEYLPLLFRNPLKQSRPSMICVSNRPGTANTQSLWVSSCSTLSSAITFARLTVAVPRSGARTRRSAEMMRSRRRTQMSVLLQLDFLTS